MSALPPKADMFSVKIDVGAHVWIEARIEARPFAPGRASLVWSVALEIVSLHPEPRALAAPSPKNAILARSFVLLVVFSFLPCGCRLLRRLSTP
jgi:hypothetical protein